MSSQQPPPDPDGPVPPPNANGTPPPPPPNANGTPPPPPPNANGAPPPNAYGQPQYTYVKPAKRPLWRKVVGTILVVVPGLALLSMLSNQTLPRAPTNSDPAQTVGYLIGNGIGFLVTIGLPVTIGLILLLKQPKGPKR